MLSNEALDAKQYARRERRQYDLITIFEYIPSFRIKPLGIDVRPVCRDRLLAHSKLIEILQPSFHKLDLLFMDCSNFYGLCRAGCQPIFVPMVHRTYAIRHQTKEQMSQQITWGHARDARNISLQYG